MQIVEDPCWNESDKWTARNLYARFISLGYGRESSISLASAGVCKKKWAGTMYADWIETVLSSKL